MHRIDSAATNVNGRISLLKDICRIEALLPEARHEACFRQGGRQSSFPTSDEDGITAPDTASARDPPVIFFT